jgi:lambda family phage minor tail protein L|tara:strand:- start:564 stop:1580 length:1017 start_codon:yes stop_codon:yes gene_type:complete
MAYTAWAASTAFAVGDVRRATTSQNNGVVFECIEAGTSGSTEPVWPTSLFNVDSTVNTADADAVAGNCLLVFNEQCVTAGAVVDGTVTWKAISSIYADLSAISPSAIIELFELHYDSTLHGSSDILRWHAGANDAITGNITWNGNDYARLPVKAEGFEYKNSGSLPRPTLSVANLNSAITALLIGVNAITPGNDLIGAKVKRIRTLKKFLDGESGADPYATFPVEEWFVDRKASESRDVVTFELASKFDLSNKQLPNRQVVANICQWVYKSSECGYVPGSEPGKVVDGVTYYRFDKNDEPETLDANDVCGKRLSSCKCRFGDNNELPFGSFPGAGLLR